MTFIYDAWGDLCNVHISGRWEGAALDSINSSHLLTPPHTYSFLLTPHTSHLLTPSEVAALDSITSSCKSLVLALAVRSRAISCDLVRGARKASEWIGVGPSPPHPSTRPPLQVRDGRIGAAAAAAAARVAEQWQIDEWGEVEAGHDLDEAELIYVFKGFIIHTDTTLNLSHFSLDPDGLEAPCRRRLCLLAAAARGGVSECCADGVSPQKINKTVSNNDSKPEKATCGG